MPSVNEFKKSWDKSGRPRTVDGLAQVLRDAGLSEEQMEQVFESQGLKYQSPLKYPEPEEPQQEQPQPEEKIPVPIGFKVTSKTGNEVVWKGAQWVSKGRPIKREYVTKVEAAAQYALKKQLAQKKKDEEEAQRKKDSEYDFEHEDYEMQDVPADSPEQKVQAMQSKAKGEQPGKPDETLKRIAAVMKALGMTAADL